MIRLRILRLLAALAVLGLTAFASAGAVASTSARQQRQSGLPGEAPALITPPRALKLPNSTAELFDCQDTLLKVPH